MDAQALTVDLPQGRYPIYFHDVPAQLRADLAALRQSGRQCFAISDARVLHAQPDYLPSAGFRHEEIFSLPAGESTKGLEAFGQTLSFLAGQAANRDAALFAFGGGVIGDLAGFVAASYLRGVDFYQIPSTLLAMVDSSVGGKTGINLPEGKNLAGAFWQPRAVYADRRLLTTLPAREFAAGMAEVIKYGLLTDEALFARLEELDGLKPDAPELTELVRRCCAIKAAIVADDEKETAAHGGRALLNLGHTFAHAIENVAGYGSYLHGEAVAIGLVLAAQLSVHRGQLEPEAVPRIERLLRQFALPTLLKEPLPVDLLVKAMQRDKKNRGGALRFITLEAVGRAVTTDGIEADVVRKLWMDFGAA